MPPAAARYSLFIENAVFYEQHTKGSCSSGVATASGDACRMPRAAHHASPPPTPPAPDTTSSRIPSVCSSNSSNLSVCHWWQRHLNTNPAVCHSGKTNSSTIDENLTGVEASPPATQHSADTPRQPCRICRLGADTVVRLRAGWRRCGS